MPSWDNRQFIAAIDLRRRALQPDEPEIDRNGGRAVSKARRKKSPNTDLVKAVQHRTEDILDFYEEIEDDRTVIVLDYQKQTINAYHYEEYKATLSTESQAVYDQEYEKAVAEDKVLVVVWDRVTGRLVITTFDRD
jgi:hypothetical protein